VKAIVIGAGIGGLSCAIALRMTGWDVTVYERAPELREVGAGISIWANALRSLDHLGAGDAVRAVGRAVTRGEFLRADGRVILSYDPGEFERKLQLPATVTMTHRAELIAALASCLPSGVVRCGRTLADVRIAEDRAVARFAEGGEESADLLVGADGLNSTVRDCVYPNDARRPPRYSGYTAWRGVASAPSEVVRPGYVAEVWGRGQRFGIASLPDGPGGARVYWWATKNVPSNGREPDERAYLLSRFSPREWASPVPQLLEATPSGTVIRGDILDRPPRRAWSRGPVVLVGDAAHPTTPNLGQGGCMAIEDAPVLARCLNGSRGIPGGLARFEAERFKRTSAITAESWRLGWLGQRSNPVVCAVRDFCFGLAPQQVAFKMMLKWTRHDTGGVRA
jgi:2-polyprenyl-6-methoxyphenol hydroxylase-like FAD-dependent oxidoreductase